MPLVKHQPARVQVELFLVLLEVFGILHGLLQEDGLGFLDLALAEKLVNLLLRVLFSHDEHFG